MGFRGEYSPDSLPRRRMFQGIAAMAGSWAAQNADQLADFTSQTIKGAEFLYYLNNDTVFRNFINPPEIAGLLTSQEPTRYSPEAVNKTRIITFGDSLAIGEVDGGIDFPSVWLIAQKMNHHIDENNWTWQNEAINGSTTADVRKQIAKAQIADAASIDTDIVLSTGSNDLLQETKLINQLQILRQNPTDISTLRTFTHDFDDYLHTYRQNMQSVLQDIHRLCEDQDVQLNRIFVHSSPSIDNARYIALPNGQILPMEGATKEFAARCSTLINTAMAKTTIATSKQMPFDVRFVNNTNLKPEDFSGMHPNEAGYTKMAHNQMKQSITSLPIYEGTTLYDLAA